MSSDLQILQAFTRRCGTKVFYADVVTIQFEEVEGHDALEDVVPTSPKTSAGPRFGPPKKAYLCVGQSCLCLLASSMSRRLQAFNGQVDYAWMEKVAVDASSRTKFLVALSLSKVKASLNSFYKGPSQFIVESDDRDELLKLISTYFVADGLHRHGKFESLPRFQHDLGTSPAPSSIVPPTGYKKASFRNYTFFIRKDFQDVPNAVSKAATGHFSMAASKLFDRTFSWSSSPGDVELLVSVVDPLPLASLRPLGREHVRWVALECKQSLLRSWNARVVHNRPYMKKMNLANDVASWSCWEMFIEDNDFTWAVIVLRRQYVPPVLDTAQDFILAMKCRSAKDRERKKNVEACLMRELAFIADSFSPQPHPNLNLDLVQAKLDALLFDDEAFHWIYDRFKLVPVGHFNIHMYCTVFVKGVVKKLYNEHVLNSSECVNEMELKTDAVCSSGTSDADMERVHVILKALAHPGEGLPRTNPNPESIHAWQARVACYFAYQMDGGMLGSRITLATLVEGVHNGRVPQEVSIVFENILACLLHLRAEDLRVPWELKVITAQMLGLGLLSPLPESAGKSGDAEVQGVQCSFNDRVMQVLLETGHLRKVLQDEDAGKDCMSMEYAHLLANLLSCSAASTNLKACVCRLIIADEAVGEKGQSIVLADGLARLMQKGSSFLVTYASAAMVNLSQSHEVVRSHFIHQDLVPVCMHNVRMKDTDLMLYSVMLFVQLTKRSNHRAALEKYGVLQLCFEVLDAIHEQLDHRWRVVAELCVVLGQLFCDQEAVAIAERPEHKVTTSLLSLLDAALPPGAGAGRALSESSSKIVTKAIFTLQKICGGEGVRSEVCDSNILKKLVELLEDQENLSNVELMNNVLHLFALLSVGRNCSAKIQQFGWGRVYDTLMASPLALSQDAVRERIQAIQNNIKSFAK